MNFRDPRAWFYAGLALFPAMLALKEPPQTYWAWYIYVVSCVYQAALAMKAYFSEGPNPQKP